MRYELAGGWNAYALWRTTIDMPRKVQRAVAPDAGNDADNDEDSSPRRTHHLFLASRSAAGLIVLLMFVAACMR